MGVLQVRSGTDLGQESLRPHQDRQLGAQDLQRDVAVVSHVAREVDRRHPADTDLPLDLISAREGCIEARDESFGHAGVSQRRQVESRAC